MHAAAQLSQVLLAPWRQRDFLSPWGRRVIGALMLLSLAGCLIFLEGPPRWIMPMVLLLSVLCGVWMALAYSLLEQNHPHAAHCVPGHLRGLRQAALLGWALTSLLATLALWEPLARVWSWPTLLLVNSTTAVFLLWSSRLWWLWLLLALQAPLMGAFGKQLAPAWTQLGSLWHEHPVGLLLLALMAQAWAIHQAFGSGGARHRTAYERQALMRRATRMQLQGQPPTAAALGRPFEWLARPFVGASAAWLRHLLARADNASRRSVMARAEVVLHGHQHWLRQSLTLAAIAAAVLASFTAVFALTGVTAAVVFQHGTVGLGMGIASAGLNPGLALPNMLWHSRREQALLRLLPGMPLGATLSRAVALRQLRDFVIAWLLTAVALLALGTRTDNGFLVCLPLGALPVAMLSLTRRPATMRAPTAMTALLPVFAFFVLAGVLYAAMRLLQIPLWLLAAAMLALSAALLAWRWRVLSAAPMALPAGRLA